MPEALLPFFLQRIELLFVVVRTHRLTGRNGCETPVMKGEFDEFSLQSLNGLWILHLGEKEEVSLRSETRVPSESPSAKGCHLQNPCGSRRARCDISIEGKMLIARRRAPTFYTKLLKGDPTIYETIFPNKDGDTVASPAIRKASSPDSSGERKIALPSLRSVWIFFFLILCSEWLQKFLFPSTFC